MLEVEVPVEELAPYFDAIYRQYQRKVRLEGFRKGKVPVALIKKLYGKQIEAEAIDDIVNEVYQKARDEAGLRPVAAADIHDVQYSEESGLRFKAVVEVVPDFELKHYKGLSVERETYQVEEADVQAALEDLREEMAVMKSVEETAQEDHFVLADIQKLDNSGVPMVGQKFEDRFIPLDRNRYPELTEQLVGVKPGDQRRVRLPSGNQDEPSHDDGEDYYEFRIKEVKQKELPELDDELARDVKFDTLEALKDDIRTKLARRAEKHAEERLRRALMDEVIKKHTFDLPPSMIENYLQLVVEDVRKNSDSDVSEEEIRQQYRSQAIWNLKWMLIRERLVEQENITVNEDDVRQYVKRLAETEGVDEKKVWDAFKGERGRRRLEENALEEKVLDFLREHAKIRDVKVTRKDLEKRQKLSLST